MMTACGSNPFWNEELSLLFQLVDNITLRWYTRIYWGILGIATNKGGRQQGQFALGPQCKGASKQDLVHQSHSSLASLNGSFRCVSTEVSLLFSFAFYTANTNYKNTIILHSPLARAPVTSYFSI